HTIHGVARRERLRTTLMRFSEAGIPVIVLKSAALAAPGYPSTALRPTGNIDLLVHRRDLPRVGALLRGTKQAMGLSAAGAGTHPSDPISHPGPQVSLLDVHDHIFGPGSSAGLPPAT